MSTSIAAVYKIRHPKKRAFLESFSMLGSITAAAEAAEIHRTLHYKWLEDDADYRDAFGRASELAGDYLESKAIERATEGWEEPVWHQGQQVGAVRKFSNTLLIFLLKGAKPEKYKDRIQQQHTGDVKIEWVRVSNNAEN